MGPQFDYMGPVGDGQYHHFRDPATGEDYTVGAEDADMLMAQGMQQQAPAPAPEPIVPLTGVMGVPGQPAAPRQGPQLQGLPTEYGGAPPPAPAPSSRVRVDGSGGAGMAKPGPTMRAPGIIDNGDGTISRYRPGSKGGWSPVSRHSGGMDPNAIGALAGQSEELRDMRIENAWGAEAVATENLMAEREAAAAKRAQANLERTKAESEVKRIETDRELKWQEFNRRQEQVKAMPVDSQDSWGTVILSALAAGAGAYASAINGGPNYALEILNRAKAQKLDTLRFKKAEAGKDLATERDEYDRYISPTLEGRRLEMKAAIEREQIEEMKVLEKDAKLRSIHPQMAEIRAQAEAQHQQTLGALYSQYQVESTERYSGGSPGGWTREIDPELEIQAKVGGLKRGAREAEKDPGSAPVKWQGKTLGVIETTEAKELNTELRQFKAAYQVLEKIKRLQKKGNMLSDNDRAELAALDYNAIQAIRKPGMSSDSDFARMGEAAGAGDWDLLLDKNYVKADTMQKVLLENTKSFADQQLGRADFLDDWVKTYRPTDMDHRYNDPDQEE